MTSSLGPMRAMELVAPYFDEEWAQTGVNQIHVERVTGGLMNTLHLISRSTPAVKEPSAVLIRHFGLEDNHVDPPGDSISLSAAQQAIVYWEMGSRGWGPRIYGFFPGGRVEEYIDSHTLTPEEATEPEIMSDVARAYARFHSLQLPLRKDGFKRVNGAFIRAVKVKRDQVLRDLDAIDDPRAVEYADIFRSTDWIAELNFVASLFEQHNCKTTLAHNDQNHLNVLIKNKAKMDLAADECRAVLIDYETTSYSYRGIDIGGHFNERQYDYSPPPPSTLDHTQINGFSLHSPEEQRAFCAAYLDELRVLGIELDERDTVEHLLLEAKVGRMYSILFPNLICTVHDEVEPEPVFLEALGYGMGQYFELKKEFEG